MGMARMRSGFAVIGETRFLPGYSVLPAADPTANHLSDLPWRKRGDFLFDMPLIGESIEWVCSSDGLCRVNYGILGNTLPMLDAHVSPRYECESADRLSWEIGQYLTTEFLSDEPAHDDDRHGALRALLRPSWNASCESPARSRFETAIEQFASTTCSYVVTRDASGSSSVYAPHGYTDLLEQRLRPNPVIATREIYEAKADRWVCEWPSFTVEPWPADRNQP